MKIRGILKVAILAVCALMCSCGGSNESPEAVYKNITAEEAKQIMDTESNYIILDVREQDEFDAGHIEGAVLLPLGDIPDKAESVLPDKDKLLLVYCRSGRRSKLAAEELVKLGYTKIYEFGGIIDWPYKVVK